MDGLGNGAAGATVEQSSDAAGAPLVTIAGELDLATVGGVERELRAMLQSPPDRVVFDMSGVSFMDSSGIAMLLRVAEKVEFVQLRDPSASVQMVIRATGLAELFRIES